MKILERLKTYHFEVKHFLVLFIVLVFFQLTVSTIHKISVEELLTQTQEWYKQDTAEKLANLAATSLELLMETNSVGERVPDEYKTDIVQAFNIILNQQLLQHNVKAVCVLVSRNDSVFAIVDGSTLLNHLYDPSSPLPPPSPVFKRATELYAEKLHELRNKEQIFSIKEGTNTFHVFVPLVPNGEFSGAVYLKVVPDFSFISSQIVSSYDQTSIIFSALILFGLMAMFYISSYTLKERDEVRDQLFTERETHLLEQITYDKESLFTKRIYHTHHKAEKVMGFIKQDLDSIDVETLPAVKYRVNKYANFISRVIYDMKWYDPPLQTIRNPMFHTNLNEVISFLVDNLFKRLSQNVSQIVFDLQLDPAMPPVQVNEYVVWEILEPLIQNSIDHNGGQSVRILIKSTFDSEKKLTYISIEDNGQGIDKTLLELNEKGQKKIFMENISTKKEALNSGYGCYLAFEIARRCGWELDAANIESGGCRFVLTIKHG